MVNADEGRRVWIRLVALPFSCFQWRCGRSYGEQIMGFFAGSGCGEERCSPPPPASAAIMSDTLACAIR